MPLTFTVKNITAKYEFVDDESRRTGRTYHQIQASEPSSPGAAAFASGVPLKGADYPDQPGCTCRRRTCRPLDQTRMLFALECEYDSTATAFDGSPLDQPTKVSTDNEHSEETFYEDKTPGPDGPVYAKFTNDKPFSQLPKRDRTIRVLTIEKNVIATKTMNDYDPLDNKVNSVAIAIDGVTYAIGTLRSCGVKLSEVKTENGTDYRTLNSTLKANHDGWDQKFESVGTVDSYNKPKPVDGGAPNDQPWPLDEDGLFKDDASEAGFEIVMKPYDKANLTPLT